MTTYLSFRRVAVTLSLASALFIPAVTQAASFKCSAAKTFAEKTICATPQLSKLDDLLGVTFKKALESTDDPKTLKSAQLQWLSSERDICQDTACLKTAYTDRLMLLNDLIASAADPEPISSASSSDNAWYQANAKPNLVVRDKPDVTGAKVGNIPTGGKVKVLSVTERKDSIGGRDGKWVKIEWQGKTGYVFNAFLDKLKTTSNVTATPSKDPVPSTSKTMLTGRISSFECGDNCYLTIIEASGTEHTGLCTASACDPWNANTAMPAEYKNRKVKVGVGTGQQVDGSGAVVGEMDAFESITFLSN